MLFDIINATISNIVIHKIGSLSENTENEYSKNCLEFNEESPVPGVLKQYFLTTFQEPNLYNFEKTDNDAVVYQAAKSIFENENTFYQYSKVLADFLYKTSSHPNIKPGEFYLTLFKNVQIFDQTVNCIGIFKSENKEVFLKIKPEKDSFGIDCEEGINIKKLDKGCLIFNIEQESGFIISIIDKVSKGNEASFWKKDFLGLAIREDNNYDTMNYLNVCKNFVDNVYSPINAVPRENQIDMQNRTIDFFKQKQDEQFSEDEFKNQVLENPDVVSAFNEYKENFEQENGVNLNDNFKISSDVVRQENKRFKSVLKLDKNFHIYVHGNQTLMERGFDSEKQLNYYKLYFSSES